MIRSRLQPRDLDRALQRCLASLDPGLPIPRTRPLGEITGRAVAKERFLTILMTALAAIALSLAMVGIFGTASYLVAQQTREIGTRIALGASPSQILRGVLTTAMIPVIFGLALGLAGALAFSRLLESLLFAIGAQDLPTFAGVVFLLAAGALIACSLPALRATRIDPLGALRHE